MQPASLEREFDLFVEYLDSCGLDLREDWRAFKPLLASPDADLELAEDFLLQLKHKKDAAMQGDAATHRTPAQRSAGDAGSEPRPIDSGDAELSALFDTAEQTDRLVFSDASAAGSELAELRRSRAKIATLSNLEVRSGELLEF